VKLKQKLEKQKKKKNAKRSKCLISKSDQELGKGLDKSSLTNYQLIAITIGLILFAGSFSGSASIAFADHVDFGEVKDKAKKAKKDKKCKDEQKYNGICDKKKPKIKIESPKKNKQVAGPTVTITGTATDELSGVKSVMVRVDNGEYMPATFDPSTGEFTFTTGELSSGKHKATVKATDFVDNEKRKSVKFIVDTKDPKVKITSPKKNKKISSPVTITGTATDKLSGVESVMVKIDDGDFMPATFDPDTGEFTFTTGPLDSGKHKAKVKAVDFAGNDKSKSIKFKVE